MSKISLFILFLALSSCDKVFKNTSTQTTTEVNTREYIVGNDEDENGCIASAGFTWSVLKNDCIRIFEVGYRLNPVNQNPEEAIISAFVLFSDSKSEVELFLPYLENSIILNESKENIYSNDVYKFDSKSYLLFKNKQLIFEGAKVELKNINDNHEDDNN